MEEYGMTPLVVRQRLEGCLCDDAGGNNIDHDNGDGRPPQSALCASFDRIREFILSHALSFRNDGGVRHEMWSVPYCTRV